MGLFNRNKANQGTNTNSTPSGWDKLSQTSPESAETISDSESHRRKIINFNITGKLVNTPVSEADENEFYSNVGSELGQDSYAKEEKFLLNLKGNLENPQRGASWISEQISNSDTEQTLFDAICLQMGLDHEEGDSSANAINQLVNVNTDANFSLKTPVGFEEPRRAVLDYINSDDSNLSPEEIQEYTTAMDSLENHLYGKRFTYHQSMEKIRRETPSYLGWAEIEGGPTHEEYYDVECKTREANASAAEHKNSPEYSEAFDRGTALAKQYLEEIAKNPDFADAFRAGFESLTKNQKS